ncbi:GtrA family protein [Stakelama saccharophila]|uniref:GtrA family protein n=1 Tax=Stakelama saccharophila TaxID=3075605 RepID=A0ABZ0BC43_9SPHN|nr:GtrA family protein [Stakelama sp. W311]WNO54810.1 GtrA family protein [Stakelama sp. W311]
MFNRRSFALFTRNAVASVIAFVLDLAALWLMVDGLGWNRMAAAAFAFFCANSLHYALARICVFPGSERDLWLGYIYFVVNGCIGLIAILSLFWLLSGPAGIPYLLARIAASLCGGTLVFLLNATGNFRQL